MASIGDYIFLFIVLSIVGGVVYLTKAPAIKECLAGAGESLKKRGVRLDQSGVSIKTKRRAPTREEYLDATQRSFARSSEMISQHKDAFTTSASQRSKDQQEKTDAAYKRGT